MRPLRGGEELRVLEKHHLVSRQQGQRGELQRHLARGGAVQDDEVEAGQRPRDERFHQRLGLAAHEVLLAPGQVQRPYPPGANLRQQRLQVIHRAGTLAISSARRSS